MTMPPDAPQRDLTDMDPEEFRRYGKEVVERIAEYLARPEAWPVLPPVRPGEVRAALPPHPPGEGEPMEAILEDFDRLILPNTTHWNHPGFFAYFAISGSAAGVLGEALTAALNVNAMLWRTGPAATELEEVTLDWLRQLLGLPREMMGTINDTASTSTLYALAAAREMWPELRIREHGLAGRSDVPAMRVYCSEEAHSSVDKAVITLGLGLSGVRRLPTDAEYRMDVGALERAIAEDRALGVRPLAVVATVGTTSTTSVDPVREIAAVCEREALWLHVDAAYGGSAAVLPELRWAMEGAERADSIVVNPHKWLFVPLDCSVLYTRRPEVLRRAFSLTPEYLTTTAGDEVLNLMDYGVALGRRFRSLKLWFVLRWFGATGLQARLAEHIRLAQLFRGWVATSADFELLAPAPFSVVVFRHHPPGMDDEAELDRLNAALLERVNASGEVFLSHTRAKGRYAIRLAVGNIRTREAHVRRAWEIVRGA
ncbi:MAG TPA: pyridoxal-dependent decarboxylase [Longimicrobiales bacterium]|nr:pyridoxal-dependent decarboxylase [Longimicrobiales bacterium]